MAASKDQIRDLLGTGLRNEVVASAVGCDPSYISQLMAEEEFAASVVALRTATLVETSKRDSNINRIEDSLVEKVQELLDTQQIYKPNDILRAFSVINNAKRRGVPATESVTINATVVNLQIPERVVKTFTTNKEGEVIEIEGQTMVTMPAHTLLKDLIRKGKNNEAYAKAARFLPASITERDTETNE